MVFFFLYQMKKTQLFLLAILIFASLNVFGQNEEYKVYFHSGNAWIKVKGDVRKIDRDVPLLKNDVLCIDNNACVVLINKASVPMAIKTPGEYSVRKITTQYSKMGDSNITEEFFAYVVQSISGKNEKTHTSGGVYKEVDFDFWMKKTPNNAVLIIDDEFTLSWDNAGFDTAYVKIARNLDDSLPLVLKTTGTYIRINLNEIPLQPGSHYLWTVEEMPGKIDNQFSMNDFTLADKEFSDSFQQSLNEIIANSPNTEMRKLGIMRLYIDNNIYPQADITSF